MPPETDVVFLALHGTYGEDGTVQRHLDRLGVLYTGCDAQASRLAFDKVLTKKRCLAAGVPTARFPGGHFRHRALARRLAAAVGAQTGPPGLQCRPAICRRPANGKRPWRSPPL